ncbi:hypothetical protein P4U90_02045 [Cytobacillus kochii]|uniref:hypothetical protein n=1 Tax=Cytobacillus kochii TaxID=859143 RepID=UPI002E1AF38C|nr:hypothetical protein [Cytobacillus kochii]
MKVIKDLISVIDDDCEGKVLHWLIEGKSYRWIGMHMGLSSSHIKRLRDSVVTKMVKETNRTNDTKLIKHKSC